MMSPFTIFADTRILVTDVGATHFRIAHAVVLCDGTIELRGLREYDSQKLTSGRQGVLRYLSEVQPGDIDFACFGVAGPVDGMQAQLTNLPWLVDGFELAA